MFITTSRKSSLAEKKIARYFSLFLKKVQFIPRGKTNLLKLYTRSQYLGYDFFLKIKCSKNNDYILEIYKLISNQYKIFKIYKISIKELDLNISRKDLDGINLDINAKKDFLFFLEDDYFRADSNYVFKNIKDNLFGFFYKNQSLGFSFKIEEVN